MKDQQPLKEIVTVTEEETADRIRAAFGDNYDRLVDVKTRWDPDNLFRMNKNIEPRRR